MRKISCKVKLKQCQNFEKKTLLINVIRFYDLDRTSLSVFKRIVSCFSAFNALVFINCILDVNTVQV